MKKTLRFNRTVKEVESKFSVLNFREVFAKLMDDALSRPHPLWVTCNKPSNPPNVDLKDAFGQVVSYAINEDGTIDILCDVLENEHNQDLKCELNGTMLLRDYSIKNTEMLSISSLHLKSETTIVNEQDKSQLEKDEQIAIKMLTAFKQFKRAHPHKPSADVEMMLGLLQVVRNELKKE